MRPALGWLGQLVAWSAIVAVAGVLLAAVLVPRFGGGTPYTVLTGSMQPGMPPGTLVVTRPVAPEDIAVGAVITYQLRSGEPAVATHRVVAAGLDGRGEHVFQTQGDANAAPDRAWVRPVQVVGERWYSVPQLGHVNTLLSGQQRQTAVYAVAVLLLGYAAFMLTGSVRDRVRPKGGTP
jgi:signal peptidase